MNLSNYFKTSSLDNCYIKTFSSNTSIKYGDGNVQILKPTNNNLELTLPSHFATGLFLLYNDSIYTIKIFIENDTNKYNIQPNYIYRLICDGLFWTIVESEEMADNEYQLYNSNVLSTRQNIFNTSLTNSLDIAYTKYNNEEYVIVAYSNGTYGNKGATRIGRLESGNVVWGNEFFFNSIDSDSIFVEVLSNSRIVVSYHDVMNGKGYAISAFLDEINLTIDFQDIATHTTEYSATDVTNVTMKKISDYVTLITFKDLDNNYGTAVSCATSATCTTVCSTKQVFNNDDTGHIGFGHITTGKTIIGYFDENSNTAYAVIANVMGSSVTFYNRFKFNYGGTEFIDISKIDESNATQFIIAYKNEFLSGKGCMLLGEIVNTNELSTQDYEHTVTDGEAEYFSLATIPSLSNKLTFAYKDVADAGYGKLFTFFVDGSNILNFNNKYTFNENEVANIPLINIDDNSFTNILIGHQEEGLVKYGMVSVIS